MTVRIARSEQSFDEPSSRRRHALRQLADNYGPPYGAPRQLRTTSLARKTSRGAARRTPSSRQGLGHVARPLRRLGSAASTARQSRRSLKRRASTTSHLLQPSLRPDDTHGGVARSGGARQRRCARARRSTSAFSSYSDEAQLPGDRDPARSRYAAPHHQPSYSMLIVGSRKAPSTSSTNRRGCIASPHSPGGSSPTNTPTCRE